MKCVYVDIEERTRRGALVRPKGDERYDYGCVVLIPEQYIHDLPDYMADLDTRAGLLDRVAEATGAGGDWGEAVAEAEVLSERVGKLTRRLELCESSNHKQDSKVIQLTESLGGACKERDKALGEVEELREKLRVTEEQNVWMADAGSERDLLRNQVAELERELNSCRSGVSQIVRQRDEARRALEAEEDSGYKCRCIADQLREKLCETEARAERAKVDRDEARREAEEWRDAYHYAKRGRNTAEREAEELRAENERLREERDRLLNAGVNLRHLLSQYSLTNRAAEEWDDAVRQNVNGRQSAPQTHYREGDLVESGARTFRLGAPIEQFEGHERWVSEDSCTGDVALVPGKYPILERDGVPTDDGLRRLTEKAGRKLEIHPFTSVRFVVHETEVVLAKSATASDRRALAAALREMGDDSQPREGRKARSDE